MPLVAMRQNRPDAMPPQQIGPIHAPIGQPQQQSAFGNLLPANQAALTNQQQMMNSLYPQGQMQQQPMQQQAPMQRYFNSSGAYSGMMPHPQIGPIYPTLGQGQPQQQMPQFNMNGLMGGLGMWR